MVTDMLTRTGTSVLLQPLLTAKALAPHLNISVGQVYRLARTKQIPSHHLGAAVRFNLEEVLAATATTQAKTPAPTRVPSHRSITRLQAMAKRPKRTALIDWRTA
jgi:excisionase family DNA binding protein